MNVTSRVRRGRWIQIDVAKMLAALRYRLAAKISDSRLITEKVNQALALKPRGAVANDVLVLKNLSVQLHVEWIARDVHPWDGDLPESRKAEVFAQQCLKDVDAAIPRLFSQLPEVDVIELGVVEGCSSAKIIGGTVRRDNILSTVSSSVGMKLKTIGVTFRLSNLRLEHIG